MVKKVPPLFYSLFSDIFLSIVEDNGIYSTKNGQQVWTLIGSDGIEFITIAFWDKYIRDWQSVLGRDLVVVFQKKSA